jgi:hypothetical protein
MLFLSHQNLVPIYDVDAPLKGVAASAIEGIDSLGPVGV